MNRILPRYSLYPFSQVVQYTRRGPHRPKISLAIGETVGSFKLCNLAHYRDFGITHLHLLHPQQNTKIHLLECAQQNNTLALLFPTPVLTKPAINHALQRMLQCGSNRFPVRDLARNMSERSFSRLIPAITTDKYLLFAFSSPNFKDFDNLLNVYCSMLFDPLMREEDFYEVVRGFTFSDGRLAYSGKLVSDLSQNQYDLDTQLYSLISRELLNQNSSLCAPIDLLQLSFADIVKFHRETITLPNCTMILHGDMSPQRFIHSLENALAQAKPKPGPQPLQTLIKQKPSLPKTVTYEHLRRQTVVMLSFQVDGATEEEKVLLSILSYLLFDLPESPFMRFNTPQTPYPSLYGYHNRYFNVGATFFHPSFYDSSGIEDVQLFRQRQKILLEKEKVLWQTLSQVANRLEDSLVKKGLLHLESSYYEQKGQKIIQSVIDPILEGHSLSSVFEVLPLIHKLLKSYKREEIFQKIIRKFLLENQDYVVLRGLNNPNLLDIQNKKNSEILYRMQQNPSSQALREAANYKNPSLLQDFACLPTIKLTQLQFFEDLKSQIERIRQVKTFFGDKIDGSRLTLKFDVTDIGEDNIPLLGIFCSAFPQMGCSSITDGIYRSLVQTYLAKLDMRFETSWAQGGLKLHLLLSFEFSDRNHEFAFNIANGLLHDFNFGNLSALSRTIQSFASLAFNDVSQNLLHYHGAHLAASQSPFAFFQSPIFSARSVCGMAADMAKASNPKPLLVSLKYKFQQIWSQMVQQDRIQALVECRSQRRQLYRRHLEILFGQIKDQGIKPECIQVEGFPKQKWMKYFPNYEQEFSFEAFPMPYRKKQSPSSLVLAANIDRNIAKYNRVGGCFLYKGAMVAFLQGGRKKYLQLEDYYKKIQDLDSAKRRIFQYFGRYTLQQEFRTGVTLQQARFFKQAVISVQKAQVQELIHGNILNAVKKGESSMLALGPRLNNYEPLMKKGWQIERSIDDVSLRMESLSNQEISFHLHRYIQVC